MQSKDALYLYSIYTGAEREMTVYLVKKVKFLAMRCGKSMMLFPYCIYTGVDARMTGLLAEKSRFCGDTSANRWKVWTFYLPW